MSEEDILDLFCAWWDREYPRISDQAVLYRGFSIRNPAAPNVTVSPHIRPLDEDPSICSIDSEGAQDMRASWRVNELLSASCTQPRYIRETASSGSNPDPFSYIIASDIRPYMYLPVSDSFMVMMMTLDAFLSLCGLPRSWITQALYLGRPIPSMWAPTKTIQSIPRILPRWCQARMPNAFWDGMSPANPYNCSVQNLSLLPDTLFPHTNRDPRGPWFVSLPSCISRSAVCRIERCLLQFASVLSDSGETCFAAQMALPLAILCAAVNEFKRYVVSTFDLVVRNRFCEINSRRRPKVFVYGIHTQNLNSACGAMWPQQTEFGRKYYSRLLKIIKTHLPSTSWRWLGPCGLSCFGCWEIGHLACKWLKLQ